MSGTALSPDVPDIQDILRARAHALAQIPDQRETGECLDVVEFRLAKECYAIERQYVREVQPLKNLTPIPGTPPFMLGVVHIRGQILSVIDIKKFFDLPDRGITDLHTLIVLHANNVELCILADTVAGVGEIPLNSLQQSLPTLNGIRGKYLKGISHHHTIVLDVPSILADPKIIVDQETELQGL